MNYYMVIVKVNGTEYLTKVSAESGSAAEHSILDLSYCGKHEYGVEACMAYGAKAMKTDIFAASALRAMPIDHGKLSHIIEARNTEIREKDEAEETIRRIEKEMKEIRERYNDLENQLVEAKARL